MRGPAFGWLALGIAAFLIACTNAAYAPGPPSPTAPAASTLSASPIAAVASQTPVAATPSSTPAWIAGTPWPGPVNLPILMYHHVSSAPPPSEFEARLTVTDADFKRQLAYLTCAGYTSVTLTQLFDGIYSGAPLPSRPVVLTFDDGFLDAVTNVMPALQEYGFGGAFLIVTSFVGQAGYVSWDQLRHLAASGMEIVSHTVSHASLDREPDDVVRSQLSESKRVLEEQLGWPVEFFAYPAGEPFYKGSPERQQQVVQMVLEAGYRGALAVKNSLTQDPGAPFALSRVRVTGGVDIHRFAENMGGPLPEEIGC